MARNPNQKSRDRMSFPRLTWTVTSLLGCWIGVALNQPAIAQITPVSNTVSLPKVASGVICAIA
ncbi:MAG: hypothetical protein RLP02_31385, partial [Coleofasciculus sp. C2-GNP5-27]